MNDSDLHDMLLAMGCNKVRMSGHNVVSTCPFASYNHSDGRDTNPSFNIEINPLGESRWHCFSCGQKGRTASSLLYKWAQQSGRALYGWIDRAKADGKPIANTFRPRIFKDSQPWGVPHRWAPPCEFNFADYEDLCHEIPQYALERGITPLQAVKWKLGFDRKRTRLFIPVFNEKQEMVGYSGRAILSEQNPKYLHAKGFAKEFYLYGENFVSTDIKRAYLVEGFMDVFSLDRCGAKNVFAFFGAGVGEKQVQKLLRWNISEVVIFPHNDRPNPQGEAPGTRMAEAWRQALQAVGIRVMIGPTIPGKKDVGDWTPEEVRWAVQEISLGG